MRRGVRVALRSLTLVGLTGFKCSLWTRDGKIVELSGSSFSSSKGGWLSGIELCNCGRLSLNIMGLRVVEMGL